MEATGAPHLYQGIATASVGGDADPGSEGQVFSLFGREDLIAAEHHDYQPLACDPGPDAIDTIAIIAEAAKRTNIVIVNESHSRSETRATIEDIAVALRPLGCDLFAAEAFENRPDRQRIEDRPSELELRDEDGYYVAEATFGRLLRTVKQLGYALVPYEDTTEWDALPDEEIDRINTRDDAQATYLIERVLADDPDAKLLVHVGYDHARETSVDWGGGREASFLAARLKTRTGIDPLTVSQTRCRGGGTARRLSVPKGAITREAFDLFVDLPSAQFVRSRPAWRLERGDIAVDIPRDLLPTEGAHVVEARPAQEPDEAIPMDRVLVRPGEDVALMLPPGEYRVRAVALSDPNAED